MSTNQYGITIRNNSIILETSTKLTDAEKAIIQEHTNPKMLTLTDAAGKPTYSRLSIKEVEIKAITDVQQTMVFKNKRLRLVSDGREASLTLWDDKCEQNLELGALYNINVVQTGRPIPAK